jgi:hypothetical protein
MRKVTGLALVVGAVIAPLSLAHAATEVMRFSANNTFVDAVDTDPTTGATAAVFVTRQKGEKGGPLDTIFIIISSASGEAVFVGGTLPQGAFHVDAKKASVDVAVADIQVTSQGGEIPPDAFVSIQWHATDVTRESGSTKFQFGTTTVLFVGTGANATANFSGSILGAPISGSDGSIMALHQGTIIITKE